MQVVDLAVVLPPAYVELCRLLADDTIRIGQIRRTFGFDEASNFTTYVRRLVGRTPIELRQSFA